MTNYFVYDVFTEAAFGGNPLAVIPDATAVPEEQLQKIAREFNFSETTFVFPPVDPKHTAKLRIFTPTMEIPFAGHPVIGTALALFDEGAGNDLTFELGVGPISCKIDGRQAEFVTTTALDLQAEPDPALVAAALGTRTDNIVFATHPPVMASVGLPFTITQVKSRDVLASLSTDVAAFREGHAKYPSGLDFAQFAYVRDGNQVDARMFAPLDNIPEDPATGSACATLGALLHRIENAPVTLTITQGEDMGRPSKIHVRADETGVTVAGSAVRVMSGQLTL
ncbi:PhzF family phenazine biosynthesis protein [Shimia sp. R10_1]|uniref:PhzF family phenazine biosynthesis protein n=1 Tax=Shimia sp. R10_1 TaxID=2821095 RepID=UPI001ADB7711|nr:PhzF family phenazine biosynthesis protein [Shimia sp. R10_1]MBO9472131.1 PhzF family phenazine biosynthesis protein [Shimia sp. R10_1]